jgi:hypothetical protein
VSIARRGHVGADLDPEVVEHFETLRRFAVPEGTAAPASRRDGADAVDRVDPIADPDGGVGSNA